MADCMKKTIDVFMTSNEGPDYDEEWIMPVWSVEVRRKDPLQQPFMLTSGLRTGDEMALVVNWPSEWIMCSHSDARFSGQLLQVGDLVRVGNVGTSGYTDYLTVMEVLPITQLASSITGATTTDIGPHIVYGVTGNTLPRVGKTMQGGGSSAVHPDNLIDSGSTEHQAVTLELDNAGNQKEPVEVTTFAYRLNYAINVTTPPVPASRRKQTTDKEKGMLEERHDVHVNASYVAKLGLLHGDDLNLVGNPNLLTHATEQYYRTRLYPLFRVKTPPAIHKVQLDRGIKAVHWIKLYAATFVNKRAVGFQSAHEMHMDDWVALRLQEVQGEVISNNPTANGSFTILHSGHHDDAFTGAKEVRLDQDAPGITTVYFERPRTDMRSLTVELRDRYGDLAHLGRIHLWFKLCVSHG